MQLKGLADNMGSVSCGAVAALCCCTVVPAHDCKLPGRAYHLRVRIPVRPQAVPDSARQLGRESGYCSPKTEHVPRVKPRAGSALISARCYLHTIFTWFPHGLRPARISFWEFADS